jgi:hypothetical protein
LYSEFGVTGEPTALGAVIASDPVVYVALGGRRIEVVVRASVTAVVAADDWWSADEETVSARHAVVTSALVVDVQQRARGAGAGEQAWQTCQATLPTLLLPSHDEDVVTWRGEIELPAGQQDGAGPTRRLRIREIDWFDGPLVAPVDGRRPEPFLRHVPLN